MPHPVFPLDHLYPLEWVGAFIDSAQIFIRDSWISFNNIAPQVFERSTAILTTVAPNILDLMPTTSSVIRPRAPSVITSLSAPGPTPETITRSGCKKWCEMQFNGCEAELDWTTNFAWVLFVLLIVLLLILVFCCCRGRRKTSDKKMGPDPEPGSEPADTTGIENLQNRLAKQEGERDEEKTKLRKPLVQQEEESDQEKSDLRCELAQASKDNNLLKLELRAATPGASATDMDDLINVQRDQLNGQHALREQERGRYLKLMNKNAGLKQEQVNLAQQVEELRRDLAETQRKRLAGGQECEEEKQRLRDEAERAHRELQLAQYDILALLGQINALEHAATRPDSQGQSTQAETTMQDHSVQTEKKMMMDQGSQTEKKMKDHGTQTLVDQQTQTTASVVTQTGTSADTSTFPQVPSFRDSHFDNSRITRLESENISLRKQHDSARADVARLRRAHEEHGKYQKTLEDLLASSKIVEQNVKEINERCPHSHSGCEQQEGMNLTRSRHTSEQGGEQDPSEKDYGDDGDEGEDEKLICDLTRCHECPWYAGEKHHICTKSKGDVSTAENEPVSKPESKEEEEEGQEEEVEDEEEEEEEETRIPVVVPETTVIKLGPAPRISFPSPPLRPKIPSLLVKSQIPTISATDYLNQQLRELKAPPSGREAFLARQRFKQIRETFTQSYDAFQEEARRTKCSGSQHAKKLEYAADARFGSLCKIDGNIWTPSLDLDNFQKECDEGKRVWAETHVQDRKHLAKQCSQEDIENSEECLPADLEETPEPVSDFESDYAPEDSDGERAGPKGAGSHLKKPNEDDLDSLFGSSEYEVKDTGSPPLNTNTDEAGNISKKGLEEKAPLLSFKSEDDPKAANDPIEHATIGTGVGSGGELVIINPEEKPEQPRTPTKPLPGSNNSGSASSNISSTVPPTLEAGDGAGKPDQLSGERPTGKDSIRPKTTDSPSTAVDAPLVPPSLPLPFQESLLDAIHMYEAERGHELTRLPTSGDGFLCGVNAVELTSTHMHPEIQGLTAADLMEVLDWHEYRDIVDDSRFTYRNNLGHLISPRNRTFFSVDQLASMVGLWGSRRGLDLRLGVNREDYGPSVFGGAREGRTVILWIHHNNNEERSRDTALPIVDHFSGYKRVPADTIDEAQAKKDAAEKRAQALHEADSRAKQDAEKRSSRDAEAKSKQDAKEQSKKDAEKKRAQTLREVQAEKRVAPTVPLLFGKYKPVIFEGGFKPPPPPVVTNKPVIDWSNFNPPSMNFNQPPKSYSFKDLGKETPEEAEQKRKENEAAERNEAWEKAAPDEARQEAVSQALKNARRASDELRANQEAQSKEQEVVAEAERLAKQNGIEQLKRQTEEREEKERKARADASTAKDPDHDMVDAPSAKPEDDNVKDGSSSSDLSVMSDQKVDALVNPDFVE